MALIGLCGAHRTGKSFLAKTWAEHAGYTYVDANVSGVLRSNGFDPATIQSNGIYEFFVAQNIVREHLIEIAEEYSRKKEVYVIDRTPLDALAYTRCYMNAEMFGFVKEFEEKRKESFFRNWMTEYAKECYAAIAYLFSMTVLVQPGIAIKEDAKSALADELFLDHLNTLIKGDIATILENYQNSLVPNIFVINRGIIDIDDRIEAMDSFWMDTVVTTRLSNQFTQ